MLGLRQKVGSDKGRTTGLVGNDTHFAGTGRHVDGHVVKADLLLGSHHILIARSEYLVNLRHGFRSVGHCAYSLNSANLKDGTHAGNMGSGQNSGIHLSLAVRRGAKHNLTASCNLGRRCQHENGGKERSRATGHIKSYFLDGNAALTTFHPRTGFDFDAGELLSLVESGNVAMGKAQSILQLIADQ